MTTDDFTLTSQHGEIITRAARIEQLRTGPISPEPPPQSDEQIRMYGDTALRTRRVIRNGKPIRMLTVWVKQDGQWKVAATQVTEDQPIKQQDLNAEPSSALPNPALKHIHVNGVELAYVEKGEGEPVVLVHGLISDYRAWDRQIDELAKRYRVIAYSRRYHYPNPWTGDASDYSVDLHVHDLAALIQALDFGPVHLIGHSYGGRVATLVAISHPELVRTLVVAETGFVSLLKPGPEWKQAIAAQKKEYEVASRAQQTAGPEEALRAFFESGRGAGSFDQLPIEDRQRLLDNARTLVPARKEDIAEEEFTCADAQRIKAPVMWMQSELGARVMHLVGDELAKCLPQIERVTIPNARHAMMRDNPAAFNQAVLAFLHPAQSRPAPPRAHPRRPPARGRTRRGRGCRCRTSARCSAP